MNTFTSMLYRDITCGATAVLITLVLSVTFVQSTSLPPGAHGWPTVFGQPEPAVLVD